MKDISSSASSEKISSLTRSPRTAGVRCYLTETMSSTQKETCNLKFHCHGKRVKGEDMSLGKKWSFLFFRLSGIKEEENDLYQELRSKLGVYMLIKNKT